MSSSGDMGHSQFFLVRLWSDRGGDGKVEWHGRLQHVLTGEAHSFSSCPELLEVLLAMLPAPRADTKEFHRAFEERSPP